MPVRESHSVRESQQPHHSHDTYTLYAKTMLINYSCSFNIKNVQHQTGRALLYCFAHAAHSVRVSTALQC